MGTRPTQAQMVALTDFLERNPGIAKGVLRTHQGKQETKRRWRKFSIVVNALGPVNKDGPGWSKYWAEKKCGLKKLHAQHAQSMWTSGDDNQGLTNFSPLDLRLLKIMKAESPHFGNTQPVMNAANLTVNLSPDEDDSEASPDEDQFGTSSPVDEASSSQLEDTKANIIHVPAAMPIPMKVTAEVPRYVPTGTARNLRRKMHPNRSQPQLSIVMEQFRQLEESRVEAELQKVRALSDAASGLDSCAQAIRDGSELIANALLEIAKRMPPPNS